MMRRRRAKARRRFVFAAAMRAATGWSSPLNKNRHQIVQGALGTFERVGRIGISMIPAEGAEPADRA
jgi:hypothetical protein